MDTIIKEKIVMPRVYQAYGDNISSKQAMEPLALAHGVGPVCGFDHLEYNENSGIVTIGSIYDENFHQSYTLERYKLLCANHKQQTWLSDKTNNSGVVYNAFISPSGLLHIAPRAITIEVPKPIKNSWPRKGQSGSYTQGIIVYLTASFEYIDSTHEYDNTNITWTLNMVDTSIVIGIGTNFYTYTLEDWQSILAIDRDTDCLIGIYMIGFSPLWMGMGIAQTNTSGLVSIYSDILSKFNYMLPLIPYGGKLTPFNTSNILGVPLLGDYPRDNYPVICPVEFDVAEVLTRVINPLQGPFTTAVKVYSPLAKTILLPLIVEISLGSSGYNNNKGYILTCHLEYGVSQDPGLDRLRDLVDENTLRANIESALIGQYPAPITYSSLPVIHLFNCYLDTYSNPSELIVNLYIPDINLLQPEWNVKLTVSFTSKQPL